MARETWPYLTMNKRKLLDGSEVDSFEKPIDIIIHTKAPGKWMLIDLETGQKYIGNEVPHQKYSKVLLDRIISNKRIGQWVKTSE